MARFTPHTDSDIKEMLSTIGVNSINDLFREIEKLKPTSFNLPNAKTEYEVFEYLKKISEKNLIPVSFMGGGFYEHFIPAVVDEISSRSEFYTAYTPYQPEASQGTLRTIFEYQTMISFITDMEVSNASLYDGATALYEAIAMAIRINNRKKVIIDKGVNPLFRDVVKTYTTNLDIEIIEVDTKDIYTDKEKLYSLLNEDVSSIVVQNPNFFGIIEDYEDLFMKAKEKNIISILCFYPISLGILKTPGEMQADIAVSDGQSLGIPLSSGGPYLGILATKKKFVRKMPGRLVGETIDKTGKRAYVLTLQAREQHIRREKATSNICSNQALCALRATVFLAYMGKEGFKELAILNLQKAEYLKEKLKKIGVDVKHGYTFNEFVVNLNIPAIEITKKMLKKGYLAGLPLSLFYNNMENYLLVSITEKRSETEIEDFIKNFKTIIKDA